MGAPLVFIPRQQGRLAETCAQVEALGFATLPFSLLTTKPVAFKVPQGVTGLIITSQAAVEAIPPTKLPCYCVGIATAKAAQNKGLHVAYTGQGNGQDLALWLAANLPAQCLAHPTAHDVEKKWYNLLEEKGFTVTEIIAYKKTYQTHFPDEVVCRLAENKVSYTLVFSGRAAKALQTLCQNHHLPAKALGTIVAISPKVATQFENLFNVRVAKHPQLQEMLNVLEQTP